MQQQYHRVLFLISRKDYTEEFNRWRNSHKGSTDCVGYQGMAFDYARNLYEISKDPKSAAKKDVFKKESVHMLKEVAKVSADLIRPLCGPADPRDRSQRCQRG